MCNTLLVLIGPCMPSRPSLLWVNVVIAIISEFGGEFLPVSKEVGRFVLLWLTKGFFFYAQ